MPNIIQEKIEALKQFEKEHESIVIQLAANYEAEILDMNTDQLEKGIEATGNPVSPPYRPLTISIKQQKGQPTDRVTLKDEGDFHDSFFLVLNQTSFAIYAKDEKTARIERKYGRDIFGLTDENLQSLIEMIKPDLIDTLKSMIC